MEAGATKTKTKISQGEGNPAVIDGEATKPPPSPPPPKKEPPTVVDTPPPGQGGGGQGDGDENAKWFSEFVNTLKELPTLRFASQVAPNIVPSYLEIIGAIFTGKYPQITGPLHNDSDTSHKLWNFTVDTAVPLINATVQKGRTLRGKQPAEEGLKQFRLFLQETRECGTLALALTSIVNIISENLAPIPSQEYVNVAKALSHIWNEGSLDPFFPQEEGEVNLGSGTVEGTLNPTHVSPYHVLTSLTLEGSKVRSILGSEEELISVKRLVQRASKLSYDSKPFILIVETLSNLCAVGNDVIQELATGTLDEDDGGEVYVEHFIPGIYYPSCPNHTRVSVSSLFRNMTINTETHPLFLDKDKDLLSTILAPIVVVNNAEYTEDEKLGMPTGTYGIVCSEGDKTLDPHATVRHNVVSCLYQLCDLRSSRELLREQNVYPLLREYHKVETDEGILDLTEQVVNLLIQTEEEIGAENLKSLTVS